MRLRPHLTVPTGSIHFETTSKNMELINSTINFKDIRASCLSTDLDVEKSSNRRVKKKNILQYIWMAVSYNSQAGTLICELYIKLQVLRKRNQLNL